MSFPDPFGYASPQTLSALGSSQPPQYVLDQMGGSYDQSRYYWNPDTYSLVDRYNGGSLSFDRWDPASGSTLVTDLSAYNGSGGQDGAIQLAPGEIPYFGFGDSAQNYNGGLMPGSGTFVSTNPNEISDYRDHRQDYVDRGIASVAGLVGGAALGGALSGGAGTPTVNSLPLSGSGLTAGTGAATVAGTTTAAGVAGGGALAGGAAAAGGLGSLGLGGWLTVGALGAQALQGDKDITTNSSNEPPAYLQPYLSGAAANASQLYGQGNYVAPVQRSAIDYGTNVLAGNYLNSNPWLDATFNHAAGAVTNQVQSAFGMAGRNPRGTDAAGYAREGYNDLATQIYGGNYQAERDRQQQMVTQAGQLGSYTNPGAGLDDYIARLRNLGGGYGTSTSSTPTESNWLSGLAGLGLAMMPRVGA